MALVIIGGLLTACFCLVQALYILRSGSLHPFFLKPGVTSQSAAKPTKVGRLRYALVYLFPGLAIVAILTVALLKADKSSVLRWMAAHLNGLAFGLGTIGFGFVFLWHPEIAIRSAKSAYPELDENEPWVILLTRCIAIGFIAIGMFILGKAKD